MYFLLKIELLAAIPFTFQTFYFVCFPVQFIIMRLSTKLFELKLRRSDKNTEKREKQRQRGTRLCLFLNLINRAPLCAEISRILDFRAPFAPLCARFDTLQKSVRPPEMPYF